MERPTDLPGVNRGEKARAGFYIHLTVYLAVNALLVCINLLTTPDRLWCQWPLLGWGIGLLAHALAVFALPLLRNDSRSS
jgi:uncharacterized membrane protein